MHSRKSIIQYRHTLSQRESYVLSKLSYEEKKVFTVEDVKAIEYNPKNLLDRLVRKGWILKLRKGVYAIVPLEAGERGATGYTLHSFVIASVLVKPYYIGYWSALNHHGLTEAIPPSVFIATTKPRNSRKILDISFKFVTIPRSKFFGYQSVEIERHGVNISTKEKTIVDCLDHPEHCNGVEEVAKALYYSKKELDYEGILDNTKKIGNNAVLKRLAYISEVLGLKELSAMLTHVYFSKGYSYLDPTSPRKGRFLEKYRLIINSRIEPSKWSS